MRPWLYWKLDETTGTTAADTQRQRPHRHLQPRRGGVHARHRRRAHDRHAEPRRHPQRHHGLHQHDEHDHHERPDPDHRGRLVQDDHDERRQAPRLRDAAQPASRCRAAAAPTTATSTWTAPARSGSASTTAATSPSPRRPRSTTAPGTWRPPRWAPAGWRSGSTACGSARTPNTAGETTTGWFRAGCGNLGRLGRELDRRQQPDAPRPARPRTAPSPGPLDEISVWQTVLTNAQISALWGAHPLSRHRARGPGRGIPARRPRVWRASPPDGRMAPWSGPPVGATGPVHVRTRARPGATT